MSAACQERLFPSPPPHSSSFLFKGSSDCLHLLNHTEDDWWCSSGIAASTKARWHQCRRMWTRFPSSSPMCACFVSLYHWRTRHFCMVQHSEAPSIYMPCWIACLECFAQLISVLRSQGPALLCKIISRTMSWHASLSSSHLRIMEPEQPAAHIKK